MTIIWILNRKELEPNSLKEDKVFKDKFFNEGSSKPDLKKSHIDESPLNSNRRRNFLGPGAVKGKFSMKEKVDIWFMVVSL